MKTQALATIYLDNAPIGLMGDPRPRVSKVIAAGGRRPEGLQVLRALSATDLRGKPVRLEDIIDRTTEPTKPIYLTSKPTAEVPMAAQAGPRSVTVDLPTLDAAAPLSVGDPLPGEVLASGSPHPLARPMRRTPAPQQPEPEWDP